MPSVGGRLRAAGIHLAASVVVASIAAWVVFRLWYPPPYSTIAGGASLFLILVSVDVVLGPALTGVVASPGKPRKELIRDLAMVVAIQASGLGYGLYTMAQARPVAMAFEIDRMRVIVAADIDPGSLAEAPPALRRLPWFGPNLIAAVKPTDPAEQLKSIDLGLAGVDLSMVPRNWREYASQAPAVWNAARPVATLVTRYPAIAPDVAALAAANGQPLEGLRFLPLMSRQASWVTLLAEPGAQVIGHLPVDGFF